MRISSPSPKFSSRILFLFLPIWLVLQSSAAHAATTADTDKHIREIVESMLREKDKKIEQLEARILQMEQDRKNAEVKAESKVVADKAVLPVQPEIHAAKAAAEKQESGITGKLEDLGEEVLELKEAAKDKGLDISGFFDVNAKTDNATEQTFSVGSVELDLEYAYNDQFAASSAWYYAATRPVPIFRLRQRLAAGVAGRAASAPEVPVLQ